jgi:hypothetical protein
MSYFHPQRMPVLPASRRAAARQQLEQIVAQSAKSRVRRHPTVIAVAATIVVLSTGAAAAGVVAYHAITDRTQARCFTVDSITSPDFTMIAQAGKPLTKAVVDDALGTCRALFATGVLKSAHPVGPPPIKRGHHRPPHLVACAWPDGTAAIFPGHRGTCAKLGLPAAAGGG